MARFLETCIRPYNLIMKHINRNSFVKWLPTMVFAIVIMCSPANVFATSYELPVYISPSGYVTAPCTGTLANNINGYRHYKGTYPAITGTTATSNGNTVCATVLNAYSTLEGGWLNGSSPTVDGDYWVNLDTSDSDQYYFKASRVSGAWYATGALYSTSTPTTTQIINMRPENGTTTSSNTVNLSLQAYISQSDADRGIGVRVYLHNIDQNVLALSSLSPSDIILYDSYIDSEGIFNYSTTTVLADGNYRLYARLSGSSGDFFGTPVATGCSAVGSFLDIVCTEASTQFIVVEGTFIGNISQNSFAQIGTIFASTTATSTAVLAGTCNPFSGSASTLFFNTQFSVPSCIAFLFIPDAGYLFDSLSNFRENVMTHFPLGYVNDFISIISTSTESTLTIINATLPNGVMG